MENSYESGHTNTDGQTEGKVFRNTESNKAIIRDFYNAVLIPRGYHKFPQSVAGDRYVRHGSFGGDGVASLMGTLNHNTQGTGLLDR